MVWLNTVFGCPMREANRTTEREMKLENGEVIKVTEEEFQNVANVFKILAETDQRIMMEAVNGSKVKLARIGQEKVKDYVGKDIFVAIVVKEEVQLKQWDFYYKLEKVKLKGLNRKTNEVRVETPAGQSIEIEPRGIFAEVP